MGSTSHDAVYVQLGERPYFPAGWKYSVSNLTKRAVSNFRTNQGVYPIRLWVTNNRVFVDVDFSPRIKIRNSVPVALPFKYGWVTNSSAIEVIGEEDDEVICQIMYKRENWIWLTGVFQITNRIGDPTNIYWRAFGTSNALASNAPIRAKDLKLKSILHK